MYRTIDTSTWIDPKVRSLTPDGKLLFVYLFTNNHTHVSGIYYCPALLMSHETGIELSRVVTLLDTLSDIGLTMWDRVSEVIWVKKMFERQGPGDKNAIAAASQIKTLHNCCLIKDFLRFYAHRKIQYQYPTDTLCAQEQEQEQEQEQDSGAGTGTVGVPPLQPRAQRGNRKTSKSNGYCEHFELFWKTYPRREGKKVAFESWIAAGSKVRERGMSSEEAAAFLLERATAYAASPRSKWPMSKICHPATWLNQARYDDDPVAWEAPYSDNGAPAIPTPKNQALFDKLRKEFESEESGNGQ